MYVLGVIIVIRENTAEIHKILDICIAYSSTYMQIVFSRFFREDCGLRIYVYIILEAYLSLCACSLLSGSYSFSLLLSIVPVSSANMRLSTLILYTHVYSCIVLLLYIVDHIRYSLQELGE